MKKIFPIYNKHKQVHVSVEGKEIDNFFAGQSVIIHRTLGNNTYWTVSDRLTGTKLSTEKTQKLAIAKAKDILISEGVENYHRAQINRIKYIMKIRKEQKELDRILREQKNKEINDWRRKVINDPITMDDILDFSKIAVVTVDTFKI